MISPIINNFWLVAGTGGLTWLAADMICYKIACYRAKALSTEELKDKVEYWNKSKLPLKSISPFEQMYRIYELELQMRKKGAYEMGDLY